MPALTPGARGEGDRQRGREAELDQRRDGVVAEDRRGEDEPGAAHHHQEEQGGLAAAERERSSRRPPRPPAKTKRVKSVSWLAIAGPEEDQDQRPRRSASGRTSGWPR